MAGGECARWNPGDLLRPRRADAVAPPECLQKGVCDRVRSAARARANDSTVYNVTPPWERRSKHITQEFEAFALTLMREMPVKRAGEILGDSDSRMWRMLFAHVKAAYERLSFENVVWVGADEMNLLKGHKYLTVFADLVAKRVLFATPGKDASV